MTADSGLPGWEDSAERSTPEPSNGRQPRLEEFRRAIEAAADGVAILEDDEYVYVDQTHVEMYGLESKAELLGNSWRTLYDDDEVDRLEAAAFPALEAEGHWRGAVTGSRPDGTTFPATLSLTATGDGRLVCTVQDETERETKTHELERRSAAIEAANDGIAILDAHGKYVYVNQAHADVYGYDEPGALVGEHWRTCYASAQVERFESTVMPRLDREGEWRGQSVGSRKDGSTFPQEVSLTDLDDGGLVCVVRDITAQQARRRELELKEQAMDEANVGIQISDATHEDNPLQYVNDGYERITGYSSDDALGRNPRFLQGEGTDPETAAVLRDAIDREERVTVEIKNDRSDGTMFWSKLSIAPVYGEYGGLTNFIGISQDITAEKERGQRLEALHGTTRELLDAADSREAVAIAFEALRSDLELELAAIYRRDGDDLVRAVGTDASHTAPPDRIEQGRSPLWDAIDAGESIFHADVTDRDDGIDRGDTVSAAYYPLGDHGAVVAGTTTAGRLGANERKLIEVLTSNLTAVLDTIERRQELFEERERFRLLADSVEEYAFVVVDESGVIQTWNAGAESLFGYEAATALGLSMDRLHPESEGEPDQTERLLAQARITGESTHEGWRVRADGTEFYADVRYVPLEADDGTFRGYAMIVRDMSERRQQRRRTERFVEESDEVVSILDDDGTFEYVSGSVEQILGYDQASLVGKNVFDKIHPEHRDEAMRVFFDCVENPAADFETECRFRSAGGDWRNIEAQVRNMHDDDAIDGVLCYLRDVTESKRRARRFESIFDQTFQFMGLLDPEGTVIEVNEGALEFGGFDRDTVIGVPLPDTPWWSHSRAVRDQVRDAVERAKRGDIVRFETNAREADSIRTAEISVKPVTDEDGDITELVVEAHDITEEKQRRQHLDVLDRILRHNIRNDLTKLRGWTEHLVEADDPRERRKSFEVIERSLEKWETMTEQTREMRKVLQGQRRCRPTCDVLSLVDDVVAATTDAYPDATIERTIDDAAAVQIPAILTEAVRELLENAVEVTDDSSVALICSRPAEDRIELLVRDDGPGLPDTEATVLETGEETPLTHGQGLGLWLVRTIVTQAGGEVSVDVREDGTDIRLQVPLTVRGSDNERTRHR